MVMATDSYSQQRAHLLRAAIERRERELAMRLSELRAIVSAWTDYRAAPDDVIARFQELKQRMIAIDAELGPLRTERADYVSADAAQRIVDERRQALRARRCQLSAYDWTCSRAIGSDDETETYCARHREPSARHRDREHHQPYLRPPEPSPPMLVFVAAEAAENPAQSITEVNDLPPEGNIIKLTSESNYATQALIAWNYRTLGLRRRSRRYENFAASHLRGSS